jgi:anti-sigma regulatory factor (Ser/Thr protein kinase)
MRPRLLVIAAVVVLLGVVTAALAVVTVAALPAALALGLTVLALVGAGARRRHRMGRRGHTGSTVADVDAESSDIGPGAPSRLQWAVQWDPEPPASALHDARERVAAVLADWGLTGEAVEPTLLVVTELMSNAVEHGGGPRWLSLDLVGGSVRVEVRDDAPELPQLRPHDPLQTRGRGLQLVEALSSRWGWTADPPGKVTWADVPTRWPA